MCPFLDVAFAETWTLLDQLDYEVCGNPEHDCHHYHQYLGPQRPGQVIGRPFPKRAACIVGAVARWRHLVSVLVFRWFDIGDNLFDFTVYGSNQGSLQEIISFNHATLRGVNLPVCQSFDCDRWGR